MMLKPAGFLESLQASQIRFEGGRPGTAAVLRHLT
jgi:hypothetical protein